MNTGRYAKAKDVSAGKMKRLEKKKVFITGGLSGIGKSCAIAAAEEGVNMAVADLKSEKTGKIMEEIASAFIFPASDESSFMTGTALEVGGGYLMQ